MNDDKHRNFRTAYKICVSIETQITVTYHNSIRCYLETLKQKENRFHRIRSNESKDPGISLSTLIILCSIIFF